MATTEIEKNNLEAHVELCSTRFAHLHEKMSELDERTKKIELILTNVQTSINDMNNQRHKQIINIGTNLIALLIGAIGTMAFHLLTNPTTASAITK